MAKTGKYCCFFCPKGDFAEKSLSDSCPTCKRAYGFPLTSVPRTIAQYKILRSLSRGFYGATYVAERQGPLKTKHVLKIIPLEMYKFFKKDFDLECGKHGDVAAEADHVVGITDLFSADVDFGEVSISCHVAVLQYLDGFLLGEYLRGEQLLTAATAAQISADLFKMKSELERHLINHNDLHADNIIVEKLSKGAQRQGAMNPGIRAVAIDLGSLSPDRRSGGQYHGDLHWIARHIQAMVDQLQGSLDFTTDLDARVIHSLQLIVQLIAPPIENQRTPSAEDFVRLIESEYFRTAEPWRPWREQLRLRTFGSSYNAQTLDAWHVPRLLVDPEGVWLARISTPGPLVVTGMRGCGKTLLLRALQFHARAARHNETTDSDVLERLRQDNYVGLFVSAQRLLDVENAEADIGGDLFARLYVAYALEAARALAHSQDVDPTQIAGDAHMVVAEAVAAALRPQPELEDVATIEQLERYLVKLLIKVSRSDSGFVLAAHPTNSFPVLADSIRKASRLWTSAQVLFLLDDVSTRYMTAERIETLLSALIFQNPVCAFKITSEAQTIFLTLKSPGQVNPAAPWRDFQTFDLGADVHERLRHHNDGKRFVEAILNQRAQFYANHPTMTPGQILGDVTYEEIATTIAFSKPESGDRKKVYRGITALTGMCVGDIGSVISLYEDILARAGGKYPVSDSIQTEAFQDFCSRHLYLLDRRGGDLKNVAKSFAEAAYELLVQSARRHGTKRLRQYASIYVRVTAGNFEEQMKRLRELVDAGVFVFTGGAPRTKTRDSNPTQQFKLTYRKIYGLVNFIGLSERDRFELSGKDLEDWLNKPAEGKEILMRNLSSEEDVDVSAGSPPSLPSAGTSKSTRKPPRSKAKNLELPLEKRQAKRVSAAEEPVHDLLKNIHLKLPDCSSIGIEGLAVEGIDTLILGLGFEERALVSLNRLLEAGKPRKALAVSYDEPGRTSEILAALKRVGVPCEVITYQAVREGRELPELGNCLVDVTGLAKPGIFKFVRAAIRGAGKVLVAYTAAEKYYPLDADLKRVLGADAAANHHELLLSLKDVLMGEKGPYRLVPLLPVESDGTRMRSLCAFSSSKHERLLHLVETRDYDQMDIMIDSVSTSRSRIAEIAAEVAIRDYQNASISKCPYQDVAAIMEAIARRYETWFIRDGLNFELGLTGNKIQAVAAAVLSAVMHVNQAWYVSPTEFDKLRFTSGVGQTQTFAIRVHEGE